MNTYLLQNGEEIAIYQSDDTMEDVEMQFEVTAVYDSYSVNEIHQFVERNNFTLVPFDNLYK